MNKIIKTFTDSTGRQYRVDYVHSLNGIAIMSKQSNGKFKQLDGNKGKGLRLLQKYAKECLR